MLLKNYIRVALQEELIITNEQLPYQDAPDCILASAMR